MTNDPTHAYLTKRITFLNQERIRLEKELTQVNTESASHEAVVKMIEQYEHSNTKQDS